MNKPKFKIGDRVRVKEVDPGLDGINRCWRYSLAGEQGRVVTVKTSKLEGHGSFYGIDFGVNVGNGITHSLDGELPGSTGRWMHPEEIYYNNKRRVI